MKQEIGFFFKLVVLALCVSFSTVTLPGWNTQYHTVSKGQFDTAQAEIPLFGLKGNERYLDVGCGTGKTSNFAAQQLPNGSVHGIDISTNMIEFARQEFADTPNLTFEVQDIATFKVEDKYDGAYSFYCLHWVADKQAAINAIAAALKPGATAHLFISSKAEVFDLYVKYSLEIAKDHPEWAPFITNPLLESEGVWIKRAEKAGFEVIQSKEFEKTIVFETKQKHVEYSASLGVADLSYEEKKRYVSLITDKLYKFYGLKDTDPFLFKPRTVALVLKKK